MTADEARDLAAKALPCPFCGGCVELVTYHLPRGTGYEPRYQCEVVDYDIQNQHHLSLWNRRATT
jgi:hypothetical protein